MPNNNNEIKKLNLEQLSNNLKLNVKTLCDRELFGYRKLAEAIRVSEMVIRNIANGIYINPNAYTVYRIAHYFNYEMDELCLPPNEFERLGVKPTSFQIPLTVEQFEANYGRNSIVVAEQKNIVTKDLARGLEIELTSNNNLSKIPIFEAHQIANRLDTKMHFLHQNIAQEVAPVKDNVKKQFRLKELGEKITYLAQKNGITIEKLAIESGLQPGQVIYFTAGDIQKTKISIMQILFHVSNSFENCTIDLLLNGTEEELSHIKLKAINNATEISAPMLENYQNNLMHHLRKYYETESRLAARFGRSFEDILKGRDVFIAQEVAYSWGQTLHSWLTYTSEHLPVPDSKLSTKILKNMSKVLILAAGISLGAIFKSLPAMAAEHLAENALLHKGRSSQKLLRPHLSPNHPVNIPDHPLNIFAQLIDVTTHVVAAHIVLGFKTLSGAIDGFLKQEKMQLPTDLPNKEAWEFILGPILPLWRVAMGATQAYLENTQPAEQYNQEWMNTLIHLIVTSINNVRKNIKTALEEDNKKADEILPELKSKMAELIQKTLHLSAEKQQYLLNQIESLFDNVRHVKWWDDYPNNLTSENLREDSDPNYVDEAHHHQTALHIAVRDGDVERVKWLVGKGAKVVKDDLGRYPHYYINEALREDVKYQKKRLECERLANPNYVDKKRDHQTALHFAVRDGDVERVKWLVENDAKVVKDDKGHYPHYYINEALSGDVKYQKKRLECEALANPNYVDKKRDHQTALHFAVFAGDVKRVKWLIENGAKEVKDDKGKLPHHLTDVSRRNDAAYQKNRRQCEQIISNKKLTEEITSFQQNEKKLKEDMTSLINDQKKIDKLKQQLKEIEQKIEKEIQSQQQACEKAIQAAITQFEAYLPRAYRNLVYCTYRKCNSSRIPKADADIQRQIDKFNNVTIRNIKAKFGFKPHYVPPSYADYKEKIKEINSLIEKSKNSLSKITEQETKVVKWQDNLQVKFREFHKQFQLTNQTIFRPPQPKKETFFSNNGMDSIIKNSEKFILDQKKRDDELKKQLDDQRKKHDEDRKKQHEQQKKLDDERRKQLEQQKKQDDERRKQSEERRKRDEAKAEQEKKERLNRYQAPSNSTSVVNKGNFYPGFSGRGTFGFCHFSYSGSTSSSRRSHSNPATNAEINGAIEVDVSHFRPPSYLKACVRVPKGRKIFSIYQDGKRHTMTAPGPGLYCRDVGSKALEFSLYYSKK